MLLLSTCCTIAGPSAVEADGVHSNTSYCKQSVLVDAGAAGCHGCLLMPAPSHHRYTSSSNAFFTPLRLFKFCILLWVLLVPAALDLWPLSPHTYAWCLLHCITGPTCACCISLQVHSCPSKHFYLTHAVCLLFVIMGLACVCCILPQVHSSFPAAHCMCAVCLPPVGTLTPLALYIKHSQYTMFPFFFNDSSQSGLACDNRVLYLSKTLPV